MHKLFALLATIITLSASAVSACPLDGVWQGTWKMGSYNGTVKLTVAVRAGVRYVEWAGSNEIGQVGPATQYILSGTTFRSNAGRVQLQQAGCRMTAKQNHPNGTVIWSLQRVGNPPGSPRTIRSSQGIINAVAGKTYSGRWEWGNKSGTGTIKFQRSGNRLVANIDGKNRQVQVSNGRLTYQKRTGFVFYEVLTNGHLRGLQQYNGSNAVLLSARPS